jgi:hypothetical protein
VTDHPPRVEVFVRSLAPVEGRQQQEEVIETLRSLEQAGEITGFDLLLCGDCVCPSLSTSESDVGARLLGRYDLFREWAKTEGRELIGFEHRDTESLLTGTEVTGIVFPRITLAEFRDGALTYVAPSSNGAEQTTVFERLQTY